MKILSIVGARPQFIKAAPVHRALSSRSGIDHLLVHTGQHYDPDMSDVFFRELGLPEPHLNLGIGSGTHGAQTARMLEALETVLLRENPSWVLVFGDTNSTLAAALAAAKLHLPLAHVEAGLRSWNRRMPEEINRVVTDHVSTLLLTPTKAATDNLRTEGIGGQSVRQVGDVMYDAALFHGLEADRRSGILADLKLKSRNYVLATIHRAENTDAPERLSAILEALETVGRERPVLLPLHPRTKSALGKLGPSPTLWPHVRLIAPLGYLDMIQVEKHAAVIATDSGGVQKEAFLHRVPCVTFRDETEWVETLEGDANCLVGADRRRLVETVNRQANRSSPMPDPAAHYGDGRAAERIADALIADQSGLK